MEEREIQQKTEEFMGFVRSLSTEQRDVVISAITNEHRTHQQTFMRSFVRPLIAKWAQDFSNKRFDARNEGTVLFCNECAKIDFCLPYI